MSELPSTWTRAPIGDLCELLNGRAFKPTDWSPNGLPIVRIQNLNNPDAALNHYDGEVRDRFLIDNGELLFAWSGTPGTSFGAHIWNGGRAILNQHIFKIEFSEDYLDKRYFRYAIDQKLQELIDKAHGGVGLRHVTKGKFEETEIELPPHAEQERIVAKLDSLLGKSSRARHELDLIPNLIERYKQAILAKAYSGELTRDWRKAKKLRLAATVSLESVAEDFSYGSSAKSSAQGRVPVLRMGNIQDGRLDWTDLVFTSDESEIKKYQLQSGDVLFNRTNSPALVGKTALYRGEREAIYAGYLIRIRCAARLLPDYLTYCLNSPEGRDYCWQVKTDGVSQSNINAKKLAAFELLLPTIEEQVEIVRRIDHAFTWLDKIVSEHTRADHLLPKLDQAILAKAFRGELVPQDPNDEPASVLLERIRAEREGDTQPRRRRGSQ